MVLALILIIFFNAFFINTFVGHELIPPSFKLITEASVYLLFVYAFVAKKEKGYSFHLSWVFGFFLLGAACSVFVNQYFNLKPIIGLRLILRFYLFYLALINLGLTERNIRFINKVLIFFFLLQLPASAIKFALYGISELTMGTYTVRGGGLTTILPIVVLGYAVGYYAFYKRNSVYLLIALGFMLYGIVGAKRALIFLYPPFLIVVYYLAYMRGKRLSLFRHVSILLVIGFLCLGFAVANLKYNPTLISDKLTNDRISLSYLLEYTQQYNTMMDASRPQMAIGRLATTTLVLDELWRAGLAQIAFGFGPGAITSSIIYDKQSQNDRRVVKIQGSYGIVGWVYVFTEYGLAGLLPLTLLFLLFARMCWKYYQTETRPYWKAFATGSLVFALMNIFDFLAYSNMVIINETLLPVSYYAMAVVRTMSVSEKH